MLILGLDACCMAATAALCGDGYLVAASLTNCGRTHSQKIMPQIAQMLKNAEVEVRNIDVFAAAVGPGSFTGVRIGVATVKGLAQAYNKPCAAVSTLEALANNVSCFSGLICPILDARREQVYNALFKGDGSGEMKRLCGDRALALEDLIDELKTSGEKVMFLGDGVFAFKETIVEKLGERAVFAKKHLTMNLAGSVAELAYKQAENGELVSYSELAPQYIRLSQAERERMERINAERLPQS